ncbi:MAG: hypothetical protein QM713_00385 [Arachnia sp.]
MRKLATLLLCLLLPVALVGCGGDAPRQSLTLEVIVTDPPGPTEEVTVPLGAEVTFEITTPKDDEAHLHGYEVEQEIPAGVPTKLTFVASMSGTFELESHVTDTVWLNVVVK